MDQHVIKMAALGRRFQLGDLYDYRIDQILTVNRRESDNLPSGTQTETGFKLKLMYPDSDISHKWQHMGLEGHLQASILAGLFETEAEADKLRGASHYVNAKCNRNEVTRTFIIRAINKKNRLDLPNFLSNSLATEGKTPDATHIVVGIAYGAEAYCVLAQNVQDENEDPEKIAEFLNHVSSMMEIALEEKQDEAEFKEQFTNEEKRLTDQIKCRVYADYQIQPVRECSLFNAYKHCLKLVNQIENIEKAVPVVAVLCPLRNIMKAHEGLEKSFMYRDVDAGLVARCCHIWSELDQVISTSESLRFSMKKMISRPDLKQFTQVVSKFKDLLKNSWRKSVAKARESEDEDDREVEEVAKFAETHPLFRISRLDQWLCFKKAEMEMVEKLENIDGITFLADRTLLEKELAFSFDRRHTLVLVIPSLDQSTKDLLCNMKNYVDKNTELVATDYDSDGDVHPWHMVTGKRKQVLDKIREMVDHIEKNKYLENRVRFFIIPEEIGQEFGCSYSVYQADNLLKDNLTQLPTSYDETCISRSQFSEVVETRSTINISQSINGEKEERIILNQKEIVLHPPILLVSAVTQTTADLEWTPSTLAAESADFSHKIRYWRNGQILSGQVSVESSQTRFRLEDLQPGSTYSINIVATSEDGQESAPSENIEFTTHQLQDASIPVGISQNTFSIVGVDELKLLRELVTNLTEESNETKSALIETGNQLEEKIRKSTECWTKCFQETKKTIVALNKRLNGITSVIQRKPLLQGEAKTAIEKKWFDTIELTYPNVKTLENLIQQRGVDVNAEDAKGHNALHLVCMKKDKNDNLINLVRLFIENGVDVNARDNDCKWTALHNLCRHYNNENLIDIVRLFVENGVDVNAKANNGDNALHLLCRAYKNENLIDIVRLFMENGVDVNAKGFNGDNALHVLCYYYKNENLIDIVRLFVKNGVDVNAKGFNGDNALHLLCENDKNENLIDIVRLFVKNGVDVKAKDISGYTALHNLCRHYKNENLIDIVRLFVENGADVNAKGFNGEAPRDFFRKCYQKENAKEILKLLGE